QQPNGEFALVRPFDLMGQTQVVAIDSGDIDHDGLPDLAVLAFAPAPAVRLLLSSNAFMPPLAIPLDRVDGGDGWADIALADMDNDGDLDVVALDERSLHVLKNTGATPFANGNLDVQRIVVDASMNNKKFAIGDFDAD